MLAVYVAVIGDDRQLIDVDEDRPFLFTSWDSEDGEYMGSIPPDSVERVCQGIYRLTTHDQSMTHVELTRAPKGYLRPSYNVSIEREAVMIALTKDV